MPMKFLDASTLLAKAEADKVSLQARRDAEMASVAAKYQAEESDLDAFIRVLKGYAQTSASSPELAPGTGRNLQLQHAGGDKFFVIRPSNRMGPVAAAILGLPALRLGMTTSQIAQALHAMPELADKVGPENKPIYNALYGLVNSKRLRKEDDVYSLIYDGSSTQEDMLAAE